MINLLSEDSKANIKAARTNTILLRYSGIIVLAAIFLFTVLYVSYSVLQDTMNSAEQQISNNDVESSVYNETKQQINNLSSQLSTAKSILDSEVLYSKVLVQLGQIMPAGAIIGELNLSESSFSGSPVELVAYAQSSTAAAQLQQTLQGSSLFTQAELQSTSDTEGIDNYPVKITFSVIFNKASIK